MEFFNYKPEEVKIGDVVIGNSKTRFRDTVFSAHLGETPKLSVWPERSTEYLDGRVFQESEEQLQETLSIEDLGRSIDLYHPILGVVIGTITIAEIVGIVYSLCIDTDKRNIVRKLAEQTITEDPLATTPGSPTEPTP